ncbi:hypothetical protein [Nocardioides sp.]|uniref:hypothetical protein n=1 Tax=Nocardioides sp. TaxID=35761 RepID=UPI003510E0B0
MASDDPRLFTVPAPLQVASSLAAVEGLVLLGLAAAETADLDGSRLGTGISTAVFFALYGAVLGWAAWSLRQRRTWARGPVLLTQLIMLGLAWNVRDAPVLAICVALVAVIALVGMVHPDTVAALEREEA